MTAPKDAIKSITTLLIEDDVLMSKLYIDLFKCMGLPHPEVVKTSEDAIIKLRDTTYDLILCDWKLQGMSGLEFVKFVRNLPNYTVCNIPIVMITGKANAEDVQIARDAGVTEYIVKPFTIKSLTDKLRSIIDTPRKFVLADNYKGPDRRRRDEGNITNERRENPDEKYEN